MARINVMGIGIEYELLGKPGVPAVSLIPGGRFSKDAAGVREFAEQLVEGGRRVLLWDRPNCGASDMSFEGESEAELHARVLIELIRVLELGPTAVGGGSAGSRVALLAAAHDPKAVSHLLLWWLSGGTISLLSLGSSYCAEPAIAASMGGMAAVAGTQLWAGQIRANPHYKELLLALDPQQFIKTMDRWAAAFVPSHSSPITALSAADFQRLTMPALIFRNSDSDLYHPGWVSDWVHKLIPHSTLVTPPWSDDAFIKCMAEGARTGSGHFADWPLLAPAVREFLNR